MVEPLRLLEALEELRDRDEDEFEEESKAECIAETEQALDRYIELQPAKIDNFAGFLRECESRAEIDGAESERLAKRAKRWKARKQYLEQRAIQAMQTAGKERIDGKHNTLALRDNPPKVEVTQEALLPAEYRRTTVTLDQVVWEMILTVVRDQLAPGIKVQLGMALAAAKTEPKKAEIARVLKQKEKCPACGGSGTALQLGEQHRPVQCSDCAGSGSIPRGIPGARLISEVRLEVR